MKNHFKILLIVILNLTISCSVRNIDYNRQKIENKYLAEYEILIDSNKSDFKNIYLDKKNIERVQVNKKDRIINISQIDKVELIELKDLKIDSLKSSIKNLDKIGLIVFNGIPIKDLEKCKIKLDPKSIIEFTILREELIKNTTWYNNQGSIILITTD